MYHHLPLRNLCGFAVKIFTLPTGLASPKLREGEQARAQRLRKESYF